MTTRVTLRARSIGAACDRADQARFNRARAATPRGVRIDATKISTQL